MIKYRPSLEINDFLILEELKHVECILKILYENCLIDIYDLKLILHFLQQLKIWLIRVHFIKLTVFPTFKVEQV